MAYPRAGGDKRPEWRLPVGLAMLGLAALAFLLAVALLGTPGQVLREPDAVSAEFLEELAEEREEEGEKAEAFDKPDEANSFFILKRSPDGKTTINYARYQKAMDHTRHMPRYSSRRARPLPPLDAALRPVSTSAATAKTAAGMTSKTALAPQNVGTWSPLGPGNVGGRTRALLVDPTDSRIMYAGAASGGVWKSVDGGATWGPLADFMANINVNALAFAPGDSSTIYAGTGEGQLGNERGQRASGGQAMSGAGIFKSTDAGLTWAVLGTTGSLSDFWFVNDLAVSSGNPQRVYAATRTGVHRSLDGGSTWLKVLPVTVSAGCTDLAIRTDNAADVLFAACGSGNDQGTVYRNTNAGGAGTWEAVLSETAMGRTSLAIAPSNQNVVYALASSIGSGNFFRSLHAVFRSTTGGGAGSWTARVRNSDATPLNTLLLTNPLFAPPVYTACFPAGDPDDADWIGQGHYDNVVAVDPLDPNKVWAGGIDLFRSDDGGANWGMASRWYTGGTWSQYAHADQHAIVFDPQFNGTTNKTMFVGNDGGLYKTSDARAATATGTTAPCSNTGGFTWTSLNNRYAVTQFYYGTPYPSGTSYFGGTQDNGTVRGTDAAGVNAWTETLGGDGGAVAVRPSNTQHLYAENYGLSIQKSINGGSDWANAVTGITPGGYQPGTSSCQNECFLFIVPFEMDPSNDQRLWTGGWNLWRTIDGAANWVRASALTAGTNSSRVSAIAVAPTDPNRVLAGLSEGEIHRTTVGLTSTGTTNWPFTKPRAGYVSSVAFDPQNVNIAYATYSTFGGGAHVWRSADGGATWNAIDGSGATGLPDIPVHTIVVDPGDSARLYIGTDLGVYVSTDTGAHWAVENSGFPNVITESLELNTVGGATTLFAFTHGRGAFRVPLTRVERPANDLFAGAQALPSTSAVATGTNIGAMKESGERNHAGNPGGASVWYTFTPGQNGQLTITTSGSSFDTLLALYGGSALSGLTLVAENDDENFPGGIYTSRIGPVDVTGGTTYRIAVDGFLDYRIGPATGAVRVETTFAAAGGQTCQGKTATIVGTPGDDALAGTAANDVIVGLAGNDEIDGASGNDTVCAGSGDDLVHGGIGADALDGEAGDDAVDMSDAAAGVTIDLAGGTVTTGVESDTVANVESAFGSAFADLLIGTAGPNVLLAGPGGDIVRPLGGADEVDGEIGTDTVSFSQSAAGVTVDLAAGTATGEGADVFAGVEGAIGSPHADTLLGTAGANQLAGREGNDTLRPLGGNDDVHGGDGIDTISFAAAAAPVEVALDAGTAFGEGSDLLAEVENIVGSAFGDELAGSIGPNALTGGSGDDVIWPDAGTDVVNGGTGDDTISFSQSANAVTVNLATGVADGEGHDDLTLVENVFGSNEDDLVVGNDGENRLVGANGDDMLVPSGGADLIIGLAGIDTVSAADAPSGVTIDLVSQAVTGDGTDTLETTENAIGSPFGDILVSGAAGAGLTGGAGDDAFHPGSGPDDLDGGSGRDVVSYVDALAPVRVDLGAGSASGDGSDALTTIEDVLGSSFDDTLIGDETGNLLNGRGGDDMLAPGGGNDTANGSDGVDEVSFADAPAGVTAKLVAGTASGDGTDVLAGVEDMTGSAFADTLSGGSTANMLSGGGGDDTLIPAGGEDVVDGGDGADIVSFVGASAGVRVDLAGGTASGEGADELIDVERAHGSPFADTLLGDAFANRLEGDAGRDTLDGRLGADVLSGGKGHDRVWYTDRAVSIRVDLDGIADDGTDGNRDGRAEEKDNVKTDVEELLGGLAGDVLYGGGAANVLRGLGGNDRLFGLAGNDSVYGGGGNDALNGGAGRDLCRQDAGRGKRVGCER